MSLLPGTYNFEKNENFVAYLMGIGIPEDKAKEFDSITTPLTVIVDGDKITLSRKVQGDTVFKLNEEFEEKMPTGHTLKSVASLNGNTLLVKSKLAEDKTGEKIYEFSEGGLIVTLNAGITPAVAKRYYKRV